MSVYSRSGRVEVLVRASLILNLNKKFKRYSKKTSAILIVSQENHVKTENITLATHQFYPIFILSALTLGVH